MWDQNGPLVRGRVDFLLSRGQCISQKISQPCDLDWQPEYGEKALRRINCQLWVCFVQSAQI